jgi:PRC-barrel domain
MAKTNRVLTRTTIAASLLVLPGMALAQQNQPSTQGNFARPDNAGRPAVPNTGIDYTQAMDRLFQAAQRLRESIQAMAQQPPGERRNQAIAQAREALLGTQQAMIQLPPELRTNQNYRDAEARAGEARRALEGDGATADPQRAQAAVDAILVLVPRLREDATKATPAAASSGVPLARVTSLVGNNLYGPSGDNEVAQLDNLLVDRQGNIRAAVVEWGGFLGIGERRALVPIERIRFGASQDDRARITLTREELEKLPRYDRDRLADYGREHGWGEGVRWYR